MINQLKITPYFILLLFIHLMFGCSNNDMGAFNEETIPIFRHHFIANNLPDKPGSRYGTPALADFDNDGDLDFALSITSDKVFWFEFIQADNWVRHELAEIPSAQLGGVAHDVDRDGWMDLVAGKFWFKNSQNPKDEPFIRYEYDPGVRRGEEREDVERLGGDPIRLAPSVAA